MGSVNGHLVRKLKLAAKKADIRLYRRAVLVHRLNGHLVKCKAIHIKEPEPPYPSRIEVALRAMTGPDDLIATVIHELLHEIGYNEEAVRDGLDSVAVKSRTLRETVATRLLGLLAGYETRERE